MAIHGWYEGCWTAETKIPPRAKVGKWRLDFRDQDGDRRREAFYGNRTEAKAAFDGRRVAVQRAKDGNTAGAYVNPRKVNAVDGPTFAEFAVEFLDKYRGRSGKPRSDHYPQNIKTLVAFFGSMLLRDLTRADIAAFTAQRTNEVGPSTLRKNLTVLGTMLHTAVEWERLDSHPAPRIRKPGEPTHRVQYLRREEFTDLLLAAPPWLRPMLELSVHAGLRLKEATGLRWEDVDLQGGLLYVNPDNKTGRPDPVRLTTSALRVLHDVHQRRRALARRLGEVITDVFVDDTGKNYHDEATRIRISKMTNRAMTAIGRPSYGFITLRHTTASWLAQSGVDLARIREHMRHTNIQTTLRYAHLRPKHLDDVVDALDASASDGHNVDTPPRLIDSVAVSG